MKLPEPFQMQFTYWQKCSPVLSENTKLIILLVVGEVEGDFFLSLCYVFNSCDIKSNVFEVFN